MLRLKRPAPKSPSSPQKQPNNRALYGELTTMPTKSRHALLASLEVGERAYVETTLESFEHETKMFHAVSGKSRAALTGMKFSCYLFTAVPSQTKHGVRYLLCIERTA